MLRTWRPGGAALASLLILSAVGSAERVEVTPNKEFAGSVKDEALAAVTPPVITTAEGLGILWRAWGNRDQAPAVNFEDSVVVVTTTRSASLRVGYRMCARGNLATDARPSGDRGPGFRYSLAVVSRVGLRSVDGKPFAPAVPTARQAVPATRHYSSTGQLAGTLRIRGSITMSQLVREWAEGLSQFHPRLTLDTDFEGSESLHPEGGTTAETVFASSRPVSDADLAAWGKKTSLVYAAYPVCFDDMALVVHKDNPVKRLTMGQLKAVFEAGKPLTWGDLGVEDAKWVKKPVTLHGRDEKSGTRYYLEHLLVRTGGAERQQKAHGSYREIVEAVGNDTGAIGYTRACCAFGNVKTVPIPDEKGDSQPVLRRTCYLVVGKAKDQPLSSAIRDLLIYTYRTSGQTAAFKDGFSPLDRETLNAQLRRLQVEDVK